MAVDKRELVNVFDYEAAACETLPKMAYDYYRSGANDRNYTASKSQRL